MMCLKQTLRRCGFAEAERRLEELRSGKVEGIAAEEVFKNAREALKG
jgi:hypothetical protein